LFLNASRLVAEADITTAATLTADVSFGGMGVIPKTNTSTRYQAKQTQTALGGTYDLGVAKLFGNYLKTEAEGTKGTAVFANNAKRTAWELGARAPIAGKFSGFAKYGKGTTNLTSAADIGAATPDSFNFSAYQAGVDYNLSKRTNAYVIYGKAKADLSASTTAEASAYAIGLRHQF
jgi:predicted porin